MVNTQTPTVHTILSVAGNDELVIEGDLTDAAIRPLAQAGDWFRVITPYGLESATGGAHDDLWKHHPREGMWAGYRFMPSGAEGSYYCWNRTYDIRTARWTTPDPAASPWWNLQDYVGASPLGGADPSGLTEDKVESDPVMEHIDNKLKWIKEWESNRGVDRGTWQDAAGVEGSVGIWHTPAFGDCNCKYSFATVFKVGSYRLKNERIHGAYMQMNFGEVRGSGCPSTNDVVFYQAVAETKNGQVTKEPFSAHDDQFAEDGWFLDHDSYATRDNPSFGEYPSHSQRGGFGEESREFIGAPGWRESVEHKNRGKKFHTCAVGTMKDGTKQVLACLKWEFSIDSVGKVSGRIDGAECGATDEFKKALKGWTAQFGNSGGLPNPAFGRHRITTK